LANKYSIIAVGAIVAVLVGVLATLALAKGTISSAPPTPVVPTPPPAPKINGLGCNYNEQVTYHEHAHLALFDHGKPVAVPLHVGFDYNYDCLYWLHTHDTSGVIHIEAPSTIRPTLATFFAVWHQPFTARRIASIHIAPGEPVRTWINQKAYYGNPAKIVLLRHENITIEVGKPWVKPVIYNFAAANL
jgi:hypothetical protein